jgi:predicted nucleic acid-binding protein
MMNPFSSRNADQLPAYDAEYLRVAMDLKIPLTTQNGNLLAAARREKSRFSHSRIHGVSR